MNKVGNSEGFGRRVACPRHYQAGVLHCLSAGDLAIRAMYQGKTYQTHFAVAENTSLRAGSFCHDHFLGYTAKELSTAAIFRFGGL